MPEYLHPGVFVEEIEPGPRPIEGVPTSTAAFLGQAERGTVRPRLVTSHQDYERLFGGAFDSDQYLPDAVKGFFENGGRRAVVCRIVAADAGPAELDLGDFLLRAAGPGAWGARVWAKVGPGTTTGEDGNPIGFRVQLAYFGAEETPYDPFTDDGRTRRPQPFPIEDFDDLVVDESSPDSYGQRMAGSALGILVRKPGVPEAARPVDGSALLANGTDGGAVGPDDFDGASGPTRTQEQGLAALLLHPCREVSLVYAPAAPTDVILRVIAHCEGLKSRFAVIDAPRGVANAVTLDPRTTVGDGPNAAFYYPWIAVSDPTTGAPKLVPPGGHVLGVYARTDLERGVFKAPANEVVRGAVDLEYAVDRVTQDVLNPRGVNVIRQIPGRGILVFGARTLASDPLWRYVNVRRLFIFLERSIHEGTRWVVFEPNDDRLWARVADTIRLFLRGQWRQGALMGSTEQQAFFVRCDRTTMTQDDILNGRLVCEIGIAPVRPAEFVILRLLQHTAEARR